MKIDWDPKKAKSNLRKHGISFEEAATALSDPMAATGTDPDHSISEERYVNNELRAEYKRSDFPTGLVRGKYAKRIKESSNVIVLRPEVAEAFPNEEAVNKALLLLIYIAHKTTRPTRSTGSPKKRAFR